MPILFEWQNAFEKWELEKLLKIRITNFYYLTHQTTSWLILNSSADWSELILFFPPSLSCRWCFPKREIGFNNKTLRHIVFLCSGRVALRWSRLRVPRLARGKWELARRPGSLPFPATEPLTAPQLLCTQWAYTACCQWSDWQVVERWPSGPLLIHSSWELLVQEPSAGI